MCKRYIKIVKVAPESVLSNRGNLEGTHLMKFEPGGLSPGRVISVHRRQNSQVQQVHTVYDMTVSQKDNAIHQTLETRKTTHYEKKNINSQSN